MLWVWLRQPLLWPEPALLPVLTQPDKVTLVLRGGGWLAWFCEWLGCWLCAGGGSGAGRWAGVVLLRFYGAWQGATAAASRAAVAQMGLWARACDQPVRFTRVANLAQMVSIAAVLVIILLFVKVRGG